MLNEIGKKAKEASFEIAKLSQVEKNNALESIKKALLDNKENIISENKKDIENARKNNISEAMIDRLSLDEKRILDMCVGIDKVIDLDDPIGKIKDTVLRPNGLQIGKMTVPLGVIGIIYEARPNVTVDAAVLCLKSSNVCILKGGKEAINSNIALVKAMKEGLSKAKVNTNAISLIEDTSRETTVKFMKMNDYLDVLIPRGGAGLIKSTVENASVPVIQTGTGNCHVYVDASCDIDMAIDILFNAKTSRISVCNSCESMVVHKDIAEKFLPLMYEKFKEKNVIIKGCERTCEILKDKISKATEEDFYKEYLDYVISCKVVDSVDEAIDHINKYSTHHSESIVTNSYINAQKFQRQVDSAAVYVNASTRFTDGFEFGFGAEIGISTQKLHARGPMGLEQLTSTKYVISGNGQIR